MKTDFIKLATLLFILLGITACNSGTDESNNNRGTENILSEKSDSIALTNLVRQMYQWRDTSIKTNMFEATPINPSDSLYSGIDWKLHEKLIAILEESNYFDKHFIDNFHAIAVAIDTELKKGKTIWYVGDLPPFGYEADPWCNCQDNPDNYWKIITLKNIKVNKDIASFSWTWGGDFLYEANASFSNGIWKINYLQGFEPKLYKWETN
jgi:hypothetical protein